MFLLPIYTVYLGTKGFGQIETIVALTAVAYSLHSLPVAILLTLAYPLVLLPLRFYQRAELTRLRRLAPI